MAETLAFAIFTFILDPLLAVGLSVATVASLATALTYAGLIAGLQYGVGLFGKKPGGAPASGALAPQSGQLTVRQALLPRRRSVGRVKAGGGVDFEEQKDGDLYVRMLQGQGEIDAVEEHWLGDKQVVLDDDGWVKTAPWGTAGAAATPDSLIPGGAAGSQIIRIQNKLGTADQTAFDLLIANFAPTYTAAHRWRGVVSTLLLYKGVAQDLITTYYPQGAPTYRAVQRAAKVYNILADDQEPDENPDRPVTWTWSDLAADVLLDFLRHPDGWSRRKDRQMVPISRFYMPDWIAFANTCNIDRPLKNGGSEKNFRIWGTYELTQDPKAILVSMLEACDGEPYIRGDGTIGIRGGSWDAPTVTIPEKYIVGHSIKPGIGKLSAANKIAAKYVSPFHDYQQVDAQPWYDQANIDLRGEELSASLDLTFVPSHGQARVLSKIAMHKRNPAWTGAIFSGPFGLNAFCERTVQCQLAEYGLDRPFLLNGFRPASDLSRVELSVAALDASAYAWDPVTEEGTAPAVVVSEGSDATIPVPQNVRASIDSKSLTGASGVFIRISWDPSANLTLRHEGQYRLSDGAGGWFAWIPMLMAADDVSGETGLLNAGSLYQLQVRAISPAGRASAYSDPLNITASLARNLDFSQPRDSGYLALVA